MLHAYRSLRSMMRSHTSISFNITVYTARSLILILITTSDAPMSCLPALLLLTALRYVTLRCNLARHHASYNMLCHEAPYLRILTCM